MDANGSQFVFWKGADDNLHESWYSATDGHWYGPVNLGDGPLGSAPAVAVNSGGQYVFWQGTDSNLYETWYSGSTGH
jgi:hypothetical protein